jgi:hypothetical protein
MRFPKYCRHVLREEHYNANKPEQPGPEVGYILCGAPVDSETGICQYRHSNSPLDFSETK